MTRAATVLHVDDDEALRRLVEEMFTQEAPDLDYVSAGSTEAALEALSDIEPPIVLLLDRRLPATDIWGFRDEVAGTLDRVSVPTFVLSGSEHPDDVAEAYAKGAVAYLEKPVDADGFGRIASLIDRYTEVATMPGPEA
jgi:DNA-binding NtrC family response regulator